MSAIRNTPATRSTAPSHTTARHQTARARSIQILRSGEAAAPKRRGASLDGLDLGVEAGRPHAFLLHRLDADESLLREARLINSDHLGAVRLHLLVDLLDLLLGLLTHPGHRLLRGLDEDFLLVRRQGLEGLVVDRDLM